MDQNKKGTNKSITAEGLALHGFIFPSNETELIGFNKALGPVDPAIIGEEVDPYRIIAKSKMLDAKSAADIIPVIEMHPQKKIAQKHKNKTKPDSPDGGKEKGDK